MQARVDPEQLKQFASNLHSTCTEFREKMSHLRGQLDALLDTWDDYLAHRFSEEFRQTSKAIDHFSNEGDQFVTYLQGKARIIEEDYFG